MSAEGDAGPIADLLLALCACIGYDQARSSIIPVYLKIEAEMIEDCPHCYTRVIPMSDGRCPSCLGDTNDRSGYNPDLTTVTISERQRLPNCCIVCGKSTEQVQTLQFGSESAEVATTVLISIFGLLAALLTGYGFVKARRESQLIFIKVPLCNPKCATKLRPRHQDFDNLRVTFLAHRRFKEALLASQ